MNRCHICKAPIAKVVEEKFITYQCTQDRKHYTHKYKKDEGGRDRVE